MTNFERNVKLGLKVIVVLSWIGAAKCYSRAQYYQGRIDANKELIEKMVEISNEVSEKYGLDEDGEEA